MTPGPARARLAVFRSGEAGMTLIEIVVAVLLMATVTVVMYQAMSASIGFSDRGDARLRGFGRERALLDLLHRQIHAAMYDEAERKPWIAVEEDSLRLVTREPLIAARGPVMAFFRIDSGRLYYQERRDYYNGDYREHGLPVDRMRLLAEDVSGLVFGETGDSGGVTVTLAGREYDIYPRCLDSGRLTR